MLKSGFYGNIDNKHTARFPLDTYIYYIPSIFDGHRSRVIQLPINNTSGKGRTDRHKNIRTKKEKEEEEEEKPISTKALHSRSLIPSHLNPASTICAATATAVML